MYSLDIDPSQEPTYRRVIHAELNKLGLIGQANRFSRCSDVDETGHRRSCWQIKLCPTCSRAYALEIAEDICETATGLRLTGATNFEVSKPLRVGNVYAIQGVTFIRTTLSQTLQDGDLYRARSRQTFNFSRDALRRRHLDVPGTGAVLVFQLRSSMTITGVVVGPPNWDLTKSWKLTTGDSDQAWTHLLSTPKEVFRWVADMLVIPKDMEPVDLVHRWLAGPQRRIRRYGSLYGRGRRMKRAA